MDPPQVPEPPPFPDPNVSSISESPPMPNDPWMTKYISRVTTWPRVAWYIGAITGGAISTYAVYRRHNTREFIRQVRGVRQIGLDPDAAERNLRVFPTFDLLCVPLVAGGAGSALAWSTRKYVEWDSRQELLRKPGLLEAWKRFGSPFTTGIAEVRIPPQSRQVDDDEWAKRVMDMLIGITFLIRVSTDFEECRLAEESLRGDKA